MTGKVSPEDEVVVWTSRGAKRVYTVVVEEYAGVETGYMRRAIRKRERHNN
jgi:hypothetical protein